jgi:ABC-type branched-subunit amino acid transport system substrate-binding protein
MRQKTMFAVIGLLFLALGFAAQPALAGKAKVLKIGAVDSLTGWMAAGEQPTNDGAKLAAAWINDNGGITVNGVKYKIKLLSVDAKSSPQGMAAAVTKLVEKEGVKFIIGGVNPVMNTAASSITEPAGVLRLSNYTCATPEESGPQFPLTFFMNSNVQGRPAHAHLAQEDPSRGEEDSPVPPRRRRRREPQKAPGAHRQRAGHDHRV